MQSFDSILEKVNKTLKSLKIVKKPEKLYLPIEYALSMGGKRIRPVLCLMACKLFKTDIEKALYPAIAIEVFHNFTLLHDDIMDNAYMRRGMPSVHAKWDKNTAILSGDTMLTLAYEILSKCPSDKLASVLKAFNKTALGVCEGQQYDMNFETAEDVSMDEYFEMIRLKTSVLLAGALEIGALIGNATEVSVQHLYNYGIKIGLAFQLQDDLLDLYGDEKKFGKKIGSDIRENKKSYLYIKALELLDKEKRQELKNIFSQEIINEINDNNGEIENKVNRVKAIYEDIDIKAECVNKIHSLYNEALEHLNSIDKNTIDENTLKLFYNFSKNLLEREY